MFERIIRFAIDQRWLVLLAVLGMVGVGIYNYQRLPIDAVPDITNVQVQINTEAPGYSPLESEQRVTFPIETTMAGLPNLEQTRSLSRYGLSQVTVVFKDGTFQETALNGQQLPARSGSGRARGGAGGARKLTPAQEADELTGEVLKGTRSASIEDAIKNATTYFQSDPRFTPGRRAQVVQRLRRMQKDGGTNPFFQANAAPAQASGQAAAPAAAKIASKANVAAYAQAKGITEAQALADFQKSGYTVQ